MEIKRQRVSNPYTPFGKKIRKKMIDRGMTATELARIVGITPQYLSKIMHGERNGEKYQDAIKEVLDMKNVT